MSAELHIPVDAIDAVVRYFGQNVDDEDRKGIHAGLTVAAPLIVAAELRDLAKAMTPSTGDRDILLVRAAELEGAGRCPECDDTGRDRVTADGCLTCGRTS